MRTPKFFVMMLAVVMETTSLSSAKTQTTASKLPEMWRDAVNIADKELLEGGLPKEQVVFVTDITNFLDSQGIVGQQQNGFHQLQAFVLRGQDKVFINGEHLIVVKSAEHYKQGLVGFAYYWATVIAHEVLHIRGVTSEAEAWTAQEGWIRKFMFEKPKYFIPLGTFLQRSFFDQYELVKKDPSYSLVTGVRVATQ